MKTACSLLTMLCLLPMFGMAQVQIEPAPGRIMEADGIQDHQDSYRELTIWSEDFINGIPQDWMNEGDPALAVWEYRGPGTTPSSDWGTRGSCLAADVTYGEPIESATRENGFIIFDSNYWDDNIGPCGNFGVGPAPGPHYATLTMPVIDLSAHPKVGVRFHQYAKNYQADMSLQYSLDGGDWMMLWESDVPDDSGESEKGRQERINVSDLIGGQANVQLRFVFDGNYYFWMLDDIEVFELESHNMYNEDSTYGDFDPDDQGNETGYEGLEYSIYPADMAPELHFNTCAWNWGAENLTNCRLQGDLRNEVTMDTIFSTTTNGIDMDSHEFNRFDAQTHQHDGEMGYYTSHFKLLSDEEEESPENNTIVKDFFVSDVTYARDRLECDGIYIADNTFLDTQYEVGNMFVITADDQAIESISLGVGVGSDPNVAVYAAVYKVTVGGTITAQEVANTGTFGITDYAYNNIGDNNVMTVPFPEPVTLQKDSAYLVVAGSDDTANTVFWPVSGDSPNLTSFVRFFPNTWFYLTRTPMIRANFGPVVNVEERVTSEMDLNCYPNPTDRQLNVAFDLTSNSKVQLEVLDEMGRRVHFKDLGNLSVGQQTAQIETSRWAEGWYIVNVTTEYANKREVIVIQR